MSGVFLISLDFELYWGIRDKRSIEKCWSDLEGAIFAIPKILRCFADNDIHATWATVGFLFLDSFETLTQNFPTDLPIYTDDKLSPYKYILEKDNLEINFHFAPELIECISNHPGQELASHTFSHYYCLEDGQSISQFESDMRQAIKIAEDKEIDIRSFVFPRNQFNKEYISVLSEFGIKSFRGNEKNWIYQTNRSRMKNVINRFFRLLDTYINFSGQNTYPFEDCFSGEILNFPSSRFLRPFNPWAQVLESTRLRRITSAMTDAAINDRIFHLWWHPHNFGKNFFKNMSFLDKIIRHYNFLKRKYGTLSLNMSELAELIELKRTS